MSLSQQSNQSLIKIKTSQQQDKVSRKTTAKTNPTNAQTSLPRTGERNSTWLYSLGIACLLVVLTSFYYLNKKGKRKNNVLFINRVNCRRRNIDGDYDVDLDLCWLGRPLFCFILLFLVNSMNFVHLAKPKQSLVKQSMFSWRFW